MTIFPLSEGEFTIGHDKVFVPFDTSKDVLTERPTGSLLVEVQPFLVITSKDVMVLDTGLGFKQDDGQMQIHANLRKHGYEPEDVTKVLLSHLHKDHAGGVMAYGRPTFPNADYYIYQPEADFALNTGLAASYHRDEIEPLLASGNVKWLTGASGTIDGYIHFEHSGAHCPQHIVFLIEDKNEQVFFGGDEAPQLKQMKIKYVAKYDFDGKKAMQLREQYAARGREGSWQFLFYHDIKHPVSKL